MEGKTKETRTLEAFVEELKREAVDHHEFFQYTQRDSLEKMVKPVALDGKAHRMLWLTRATDTNDGLERTYGHCAYLACFTYSPYEDVGMWYMYGKASPNAVRFRFDKTALRKWLQQEIVRDTANGCRRIAAYGVTVANGEPRYTPIPLGDVTDCTICDVAYVLSQRQLESYARNCNVLWKREYYNVTLDGRRIVTEDFTTHNRKDIPFCFKKRGWANERETRLVVRLKEDAADYWDRIAVRFDAPLRMVAEDWTHNVTASPWGVAANCRRSMFAGELDKLGANS